jgi:hypothetical protein
MEFCDISNNSCCSENANEMSSSEFGILVPSYQQYPPGTQDDCRQFSSRIPVTQNGRGPEVAEDGRGSKGLESVQNPSDLLEAGFGRPGVPPSSYNTSEKNMSYSNDFEYRACLRRLFCMTSPTIDEDIDEISRDEQDFDMDTTTKILDYVYETTSNHPAFQELYDIAASKMISMDRSIGLSVLFSYDYFALFHGCLCSFYENPSAFNKEACTALTKKLT